MVLYLYLSLALLLYLYCIVLLSFLVALPASAKIGKITEGVAYSTKKALVRSVRKNNERQTEFGRICFEIENQFAMGYLLSPRHYKYRCVANAPTGYVPLGYPPVGRSSIFEDMWEYLPAKRRSDLIANWKKSAQALHDEVIKCNATIQDEESYCRIFAIFTNWYDKFILDVASISKEEKKDSIMGASHIDTDFLNMVESGANIIYKSNLKAHDKPTDKDSLDIGMLVALCVLGLYGIYWVIVKFSTRKRFAQLMGKIDDYSMRNGLKESAVERLGKEVYIRFQTNAQDSLTIAKGAKPNKGGFYLCSWALKDPKDDDFYYICPPTDYQILFNPDTGEVEMQGLNDGNSQ